eukprot:1758988-Pyramimonas_sp.AAC.1
MYASLSCEGAEEPSSKLRRRTTFGHIRPHSGTSDHNRAHWTTFRHARPQSGTSDHIRARHTTIGHIGPHSIACRNEEEHAACRVACQDRGDVPKTEARSYGRALVPFRQSTREAYPFIYISNRGASRKEQTVIPA